MKFLLVIVLLIVSAFFVWQLVLLIRDIVRKVKAKKQKQATDNEKADNSARKE